MKAKFWVKMKTAAEWACAVLALVAGGGMAARPLAAGEPEQGKPGEFAQEKQIERKGPLAGLPSAPGSHLEKIKAMGDDTWLNLGTPAPDPQWGCALGRAWSPKMPFAPDLRGAFLAGEGNHGWVNPKTHRQMDDCWFYNVNGHRWICVHPGTEVDNLAALTLNKDGFSATKSGEPVPVSGLVHAYEILTYDTDLKRYMFMPHGILYGPAAEWVQKNKAQMEGGPWYFDTVDGKWGRQPLKGTYPSNVGYPDLFMYVPSKRQAFYHAFGSSRNHSNFYDPETNLWAEVKSNWTEGSQIKGDGGKRPDGGDCVACYDSKHDRIYIGQGSRLLYFDVKTNIWMDPKPPGAFNFKATHDAVMNYDSMNDAIVTITIGDAGKVLAYDPATNTCAATGGTVPKEIAQMNGFYDPILNVHFIFAALDNYEGVMWAYRYKRTPNKK